MKPNLIKITTYNDLIQNPFSEGSTSHIAFEQVYHLAGAKKHPIDDLFYEFEKGEVLFLSIPAFQAWREQLAKMAGYPLLEKKPLQICGLQQIQKSYAVTCESGEEGDFSDLLCFGVTTRVLGTSICKKLSCDFDLFLQSAETQGSPFLDLYLLMKRYFELASNNGAVYFKA